MLSAVIVGQDDDRPGDGFYTLAHEKEVARLEKDPDHMTEEEKHEFWEEELQRVYAAFSRYKDFEQE